MGMSEARKWATEELGNAAVRDQRVCDRLVDTLATLAEHPGRTIPQACGSWAKTKAAYRLLDNDSVSPEIVLGSHRERTIERMRGYDVVLALQDTTHMVYSGPPNEEVGMCSASQYKRGFLIHSTMAVTTEGVALGLLDQKIWTRLPEETGKHILRKKRPIADKESSKWLKSLDCSLEGIPNDITVVTVCDREADIYGFIHKALSDERPILIRAVQNRRVLEEQKWLYTLADSYPEAGKILVNIPRDTRSNLPPRKATLSVKFFPVALRPTSGWAEPMLRKPVYIICAKEIDPPEEVGEGVNWLLLTTIPVNSIEDAAEKIRWYTLRWRIERFHYTLKSGCRVEELQLQTADRLKNAIALYSLVALKILRLTYQARETPDASCAIILETYEWQALYCVVNNTPVPPDSPPTLEQAARLIGKLGGHLGRKHDGMPGVKTVWRGLQRLNDISQTWLVATQMLNLSIDVGNA